MQKNTYRYEQTAALLLVEGYPDLSAGHGKEAIGILSAWRLQLIGTPELEGSRDHLESLMSAVMPYARHQLSGVGLRFGAVGDFVSICPMDSGTGHQLELRSSREGVEPLQIKLDDADLADLVRCLDRLRLDERVKLTWRIPNDQALKRHELVDRIPLQRRLAAPFLGGFALAATVAVALLQPLPPIGEESAKPLTPELEKTQPDAER
tara:strand:- start:502 stop:1125 length:624 start_codon:yes stop_codon:yes gene_type:complete